MPASAREIVFGQNMTTLTLHMSRCLGRQFNPGDEIVLSRMDHDANVAPWLLLAEDRGLTVRWMDFDPDTYEFAEDALTSVLSEKTRLVALGFASNCTGTINDVKRFAGAGACGGRPRLCRCRAIRAPLRHRCPGSSAAISSCPPPTNSSVRIRASCGAAKILLDETFGYKVRPGRQRPAASIRDRHAQP